MFSKTASLLAKCRSFSSAFVTAFFTTLVTSLLLLSQAMAAPRKAQKTSTSQEANTTPSTPPPASSPAASSEVSPSSDSFQRFRYEVGASSGTSRGKSFYEFNLGLEIFPTRWLSWRNAPFLRFQTGQDTNYGLDTSLRGNYALGFEKLGVDVHGGAGYRFQNLRDHVPLAELGGGVKVGGIHVGGNVKVLFYRWIDSSASHELVYTLSASGGGGF